MIAYLEAENAYTEDQTRHLKELQRGDLRRDQGADQGDRPHGAGALDPLRRRRVLVLRPHPRGLGVSDLLPRSCRETTRAARPGTADPRRAGPARRQHRRGRTRVLLPRGLRRLPRRSSAGLLDRHQRRRAVHPQDQGPASPASRSPTRSPTPRTASPGPATSTSSTPAPTRPGGRTSCCGTGWAADPADDASVFTETDERFWVGVDSSRDDDWVVITSGSRLTSECWLLEPREPEAEPRVVAARRQGVEYEVEPAGDRLLILHNVDAEDFELAEAPLAASSPREWRPVLPHQPGAPAARRQRVRLARRGLVTSRRSDRPARAPADRARATSEPAPTSPSTSRCSPSTHRVDPDYVTGVGPGQLQLAAHPGLGLRLRPRHR